MQKTIIDKARDAGKVVITATQMLESMIENPSPTRAEVTDVANAIYDGTDAVMLSGESAVGKYPVEAVRIMARIAEVTDHSTWYKCFQRNRRLGSSRSEIIAEAACQSALAADAKAIAVFTSSGSSARIVSRLRPAGPVYAFTSNEQTMRHLALSYGIRPVLSPEVGSTDAMVSQVEAILVERAWAKAGDMVVIVAGQPIGRAGTTNLMKLHRVGEEVR